MARKQSSTPSAPKTDAPRPPPPGRRRFAHRLDPAGSKCPRPRLAPARPRVRHRPRGRRRRSRRPPATPAGGRRRSGSLRRPASRRRGRRGTAACRYARARDREPKKSCRPRAPSREDLDLVRVYLKHVGKRKLLKAKDEQEIGQRIETRAGRAPGGARHDPLCRPHPAGAGRPGEEGRPRRGAHSPARRRRAEAGADHAGAEGVRAHPTGATQGGRLAAPLRGQALHRHLAGRLSQGDRCGRRAHWRHPARHAAAPLADRGHHQQAAREECALRRDREICPAPIAPTPVTSSRN